MTDTLDDVLEHYGVKGMKWGVRKDVELLGREKAQREEKTKSPSIKRYEKETSRIQSRLKKNGHTENDNALLKAKYETPAGESPTKGLTRGQKLAIGIGIGVAGAAAIGFAAYKGGAFDKSSPLMATIDEKFTVDALTKAFADRPESAKLFTAKNDALVKAVDGLDLNWDNEVKLSAGSIFKRVSSVAEKKIRDDGFYASFRDDDVKSYSATLPSFWAKWNVGIPMDGGFINHYQASKEVKAPSGRRTVEFFRNFVESNSKRSSDYGLFDGAKLSDSKAKDLLKMFSLSWVDSKGDLDVQDFFKFVRSKGYNALIDFNDAGMFGKTPLRLLDSLIFTIVKNEVLSFDNMIEAAEKWSPELVHIWRDDMTDTVESVLEHYGVKGMKWGVRKDRFKIGRSRSRENDSEDFKESRRNRKTPRRQLSNSQLKKLNERLQLERANKDLTSAGAIRKIQRGNAIANTILATGLVLNAGIAYANSPSGKAIIRVIKGNPKNPDWLF